MQHSARGEQYESVSNRCNCNRGVWEGEQLQLPPMAGLPVSVQVKDSCHSPPIDLLITVIVQGKTSSRPWSTVQVGKERTRKERGNGLTAWDTEQKHSQFMT